MQVSSVPEELVQAASIDETVKRHRWLFYNHVIRACMAGRIKDKDNTISFPLVLINIIYVRVANINISLPCICVLVCLKVFEALWKSGPAKTGPAGPVLPPFVYMQLSVPKLRI